MIPLPDGFFLKHCSCNVVVMVYHMDKEDYVAAELNHVVHYTRSGKQEYEKVLHLIWLLVSLS